MAVASPRRPVDQALVQLPRGQVHVIPDRCKGCRFCIEFCPRQVLTESADMNARGYHFPVVAPGQENACVHCGFCTVVCPELAIFTLEVTA